MPDPTLTQNLQSTLNHLKAELKSQAAVARKVGVSESTISKWLRGLNRPSDAQIDRLADIVGIDPGHFFAAPDLFDRQLAHIPQVAPERPVSITLDAIDQHRSSWKSVWRVIAGRYKMLYVHREGLVELSDISFASLGPDGIATHMRNSNVEEGYSWDYRGNSVAIEQFLYVILSEQRSKSELFFLIASLPVGDRQGVMYGHLLARSVRGASRVSKVSPCVLIPVDSPPALATMHGTYAIAPLIEAGIVNIAMQRHLVDDPTVALTAQLASSMAGIPR